MKLSVLIPVYNEEETVEKVLQRVATAPVQAGVEVEIIVVDDGSTDGTRKLLRQLREGGEIDFTFVEHPENRGKGAAVRTAFEASRGDIVLIQDADL